MMFPLRRIGDVVRNWGSTEQERAARYPCDLVLPDHDMALFRAVTVRAPRAIVFRWLCQLRTAPYSYDWIDNVGRRSPPTLTPGLDNLAPGQSVMTIFDLASFERDAHITLSLRRPGLFPALAVSYVTAPGAHEDTRLIVKLVVRSRPGLCDRLIGLGLPAGDLIMMRRQLLNLKKLAERDAALGTSPAPS